MRRGSACVVRLGRNKFVQLLIRSRNSSGRFVRSLNFTSTSVLVHTYDYLTLFVQQHLIHMKNQLPHSVVNLIEYEHLNSHTN